MISLRSLGSLSSRIVPNIRPMSAKTGPLVDVAVDNEGIATVTMQKLPVNSLNLEIAEELSKTFDELDKNKAKGMILTSASPTVFCAGLDITEMYKPDFQRVETFWNTLQDVWLKLFGSNFITAAAINGHSPAGGCLLAMSCEYRAMVSGKYTIGLNEAALGIVAKPWFMDTMTHVISFRDAELALTRATLFTAEEALKVGLIDESVADKAEAVEKCRSFIKSFDKIPPFARAASKRGIREGPIRKLQANRKQDTDLFISSLKDPKLQDALGKAIENLKRKSAAK